MRITACILAGLLAVGCSDDTLEGGVVGPTGAPTLAFSDPKAAAEPVCVSIGDEEGYRLPMLLSYEELLLRPPGACLGTEQCGYVALYAMGKLNNEGATPSIELVFDRLGDRYHDGTPHAETGEPDVLSVVAEIIKEDGEALLDHEGEVLSASVDLLTVPDCDQLSGE